MAYPSTFLDIQNAVIAKARLDSSQDLDKVKDWINQTYAEVVVDTEALPAGATMTLVAGTSSYTFPADVARLRQMVVQPAGGTQFDAPMTRTTLDEILQRRRLGGDTSTSGQRPFLYALLGINEFEVWPTPAAADVITIYYTAFPTALSADGDVPILEEPYASRLLEYGALVQAGDYKGDPALPDWERQFEAWKARYADHLRRRAGLVPAQFHQWGDGSGPDADTIVTYAGGW